MFIGWHLKYFFMAHHSTRITLYTLYKFLHCKDKMIQKKDRQTSTFTYKWQPTINLLAYSTMVSSDCTMESPRAASPAASVRVPASVRSTVSCRSTLPPTSYITRVPPSPQYTASPLTHNNLFALPSRAMGPGINLLKSPVGEKRIQNTDTHVHKTTYGTLIDTALYVMPLLRPNPLHGPVVGGWAPEIQLFLYLPASKALLTGPYKS